MVNAARVSLNRFKATWDSKDEILLKFLVLNVHTSPLEMVSFRFRIYIPLIMKLQWFRHRTQNFQDENLPMEVQEILGGGGSNDYKYFNMNELSRRYTKSEIAFYSPINWRVEKRVDKKVINEPASMELNRQATETALNALDTSLETYRNLLDLGICKEQARFVLPQSAFTKFIMKVDGNNLIKFLILRCDMNAQEEIREYAINMVRLTKPFIGEVWEYLFGSDMLDFKHISEYIKS